MAQEFTEEEKLQIRNEIDSLVARAKIASEELSMSEDELLIKIFGIYQVKFRET